MFMYLALAAFVYNLVQIGRWYAWFQGEDEDCPVGVIRTASTHFFHLLVSLGIYRWYLWYVVFPFYTWFTLVRFLCVFSMTHVWFYITHRLMHHRSLYRWHKDHHAYKTPPPYAAFYCSFAEHIIVNMGSLMVPLLICPLPYELTLIYSFLVMHNGVSSHMGVEYFDYEHHIHHQKTNVNFGAGPFLDKVFGTWEGPMLSLPYQPVPTKLILPNRKKIN